MHAMPVANVIPIGTETKDDHAAAQLGLGVPVRSTDQGTDASQDFFDTKRFRQIVIGSAVDALNALRPAPSSGQDDDRRADAGGSPLPQQREAIRQGKSEVEFSIHVSATGVRRADGTLSGTLNAHFDEFNDAHQIAEVQNQEIQWTAVRGLQQNMHPAGRK
jgi:hypothetical protein